MCSAMEITIIRETNQVWETKIGNKATQDIIKFFAMDHW